MCKKSQNQGHQFVPFKLSVDTKAGTQENKIEACVSCAKIKRRHHKDFVESLSAMGVVFSLIRAY